MKDWLVKKWWALMLRGVLALVFAGLTYWMPGITLSVLVLFWGAFALVDGVFYIASAVTGSTSGEPRWLLVLEGFAGVGAGTITFLYPGITIAALVYLIGAWSILRGCFEIAAAVELRKQIEGEWLLGALGVASILFGAAVLFYPLVGALAIAWWIATYALFAGVVMLALGFKLRSMGQAVMSRV